MTLAVPKVLSAAQLDPTGRYRCPLCEAQSTAEEADPGWVSCPLAQNAVCFGCCVDYQSVARATDFSVHPWRDLFDLAAEKTGKDVAAPRRVCLGHQEEITQRGLEAAKDERTRRKLVDLLAEIQSS